MCLTQSNSNYYFILTQFMNNEPGDLSEKGQLAGTKNNRLV